MENQQETVSSKWKSGLKNAVLIKVVSIIVVGLLLMVPISRIEDLIYERQLNRATAFLEVSSKWGGIQTISGPILTVPYREYYKKADESISYSTRYAHFLPELLQIDANVVPEIRKRGIYEVALYQGMIKVSGNFKKPDFKLLDIDSENVQWDEAHLSIGIPDLSGIQNKLSLSWNKKIKNLEAGLPNKDVLNSGLYCPVELKEADRFNFTFDLNLNGSEQLNFTPLGKQTIVDVKSNWADPSFNGKFLPDNRELDAEAFSAHWEVLDVNRNFPQQWVGSKQSVAEADFGVNFLLPVDEYQRNMRSAKYALLVISLSFLIFFLFEVIGKRKFHPLQYSMVGLTIVIFYSLLLSFTEHIGFNMAYLVSASLIISLIVVYTTAIFKNWQVTTLLGVLLVVIYSFIFVVLQLQDFALLVGSLGIFAALTAFMYLSRDIDWYQIGHKNEIETV